MGIVDDIDSKLKEFVKKNNKLDFCLQYLNGMLAHMLVFAGKIDDFQVDPPKNHTLDFWFVVDEYTYKRGLLFDVHNNAYGWYVGDDKSKNSTDVFRAYDRAMKGI